MAKKKFSMPFRQIHLDFHTGPWIPDVGADFDARAFAKCMKQAHVNSVTLFAKCHHGHLYYNTKHEARHPGLKKGLDLLGKQVDALHREGIRAPIYISVQCDEYAADTYPEWIAREPDGKPVGAGPFMPGWQILDMSSPYQEYLAEQTEEVLKVFKPVDGIFFDMCWDQPSCSNWAIEKMTKEGFNPESEKDRAAYAHKVSIAYMKRFYKMIKASSPEATVYFNSRPLSNLAEEVPYMTQVEIEALPTGGWGYMYFPKNVRFGRTFDRDYLGMTARFHKSWADFGGLKPAVALEYEVSQMMAHGAKCSIGDQLHPRGELDEAVYELIGKTYARVEEREEWLADARPLAQIGLFQVPSTSYNSQGGADEGATRMLTQLKHQFNVVLPESDWSAYDLLVLPDAITLEEKTIKRLQKFIRDGGSLLCSGTSGLTPDGTKVLLSELGIKPEGMSPFTTTYMKFGPEISQNVPDTPHVMYDQTVRVTAGGRAKTVAGIVDAYFERQWKHFSSHFQTPYTNAHAKPHYAAAVLNGRVGYIAAPIFGAFARHGNYPYRLMVQNMLAKLLPEPLLKMEGGLLSTETTVMRQGSRHIIHVLNYTTERRTQTLDIVEDVAPLHNVSLSLKTAKRPTKAYLAPEGTPLVMNYANGRVDVRIPMIGGHTMIVVE